ncbi:MAG: glutamate racemase [Alistipes sp.]|nr:glutamate racemase [Alistipes sp.]
MSIGVFDSGMGGLSVWQEIAIALPEESLIFFGDGLNCPYGSKSREQVLGYTVNGVEKLLAEGCKMIVIACNTATAVAIDYLRSHYPDVPFVGLEPAVKPAALSTKSGTVAVLATARSLEGELFQHTSALYADKVNIIKAVGEGFVELVERGEENTPQAFEAVRGVVEPLIAAGADRIVLGCTHYPFLRQTIERVIGERDVEVIDSGSAVSRRVAQLLDMYGLRAESGSEPRYEFMTLADDDYLDRLIFRAYGCDCEEEAEEGDSTEER